MSRLVLLEPHDLVAQEFLEALENHPLGRDLQLLSSDDEKIGQVTEAAGAAALIGRADGPAVASADAIVVFGSPEEQAEILAQRQEGATVVLVGPGIEPGAGTPVVSGVNLEAAQSGATLVSPDAGSILLAHLLAPLLSDETEDENGAGGSLTRASATLVQPVSTFGRPGLDELFAQAGRMVAMQSQTPSDLFGHRQLAFNLYPVPHPPHQARQELDAILEGHSPGATPEIVLHHLQGAVFHGYSASVHVQLSGQPVAAEALAQRLATSEWIDAEATEAGAPAPIDVAGEAGIRLTAVGDGGETGGYWLWAVMDNLTRGGALNLLEILEVALPADA